LTSIQDFIDKSKIKIKVASAWLFQPVANKTITLWMRFDNLAPTTITSFLTSMQSKYIWG
jgi:hypothetical protein